jgi:XTP/dITP diphosphohydrolase
VFYVPELDKYLAEIPIEEKNRLSHRGKAIQAFINFHH